MVVNAPRSGCSSDVASERGAVSVEKVGEMGSVRREFVDVESLSIVVY